MQSNDLISVTVKYWLAEIVFASTTLKAFLADVVYILGDGLKEILSIQFTYF